jgi:hypothetical protein
MAHPRLVHALTNTIICPSYALFCSDDLIACFKQVAVDVEREEDEGGAVGDTFMDYVRYFFLKNMW